MTAATAALRRNTITREDFDHLAQRAKQVVAHAELAQCRARELADESRDLRVGDTPLEWPRFFVVHGDVEAHPVRASWFRGTLRTTDSLRRRAELLMSMGETFRVERDGPVVHAGLEDPLAAMLTLIRSCDRVRDASFGPFRHRGRPVRYRGRERGGT